MWGHTCNKQGRGTGEPHLQRAREGGITHREAGEGVGEEGPALPYPLNF